MTIYRRCMKKFSRHIWYRTKACLLLITGTSTSGVEPHHQKMLQPDQSAESGGEFGFPNGRSVCVWTRWSQHVNNNRLSERAPPQAIVMGLPTLENLEENISCTHVICLCWFQTSLPLAALPLCRVIIACCFRVAALRDNTALLWLYHRAASLPSWIEFNCLRSAAVGKAARLSIYWLDAACRLVIPLRQVALAQLNKYHHQSGKRQVSLKPTLLHFYFETVNPGADPDPSFLPCFIALSHLCLLRSWALNCNGHATKW